MHLSALLSEGDVVAYQTGSWLVDGVPVGDTPPAMAWCRIESIQVVWTHNCEHGVLRGFPLDWNGDRLLGKSEAGGGDELVEFGPEQLLARIPIIATKENDQYKSVADLSDCQTWLQKVE